MGTPNWTVVASAGHEVVRHYPFDDAGYQAAARLATANGYGVWQSFDGEPRYLMQSPREQQFDVAITAWLVFHTTIEGMLAHAQTARTR